MTSIFQLLEENRLDELTSLPVDEHELSLYLPCLLQRLAANTLPANGAKVCI
jgi:hypothetical protein